MADQVQFRGGSTAQHSTFTGASREITVDTDKKVVVVHDGATPGGIPMLRQDLSNIPPSSLPSALGGFVQNNSSCASAASGTADAITGSYTPGINALTNGMTLYVRASAANTTPTPTFTPASGAISAKTIVKGAGSALAVGDVAGAGHWLELKYDATLDKWVLQNPVPGKRTRTVLTSGAGTYNRPAGVTAIFVRGQAAGGGGAGGGGSAGSYNGGGGGNGGTTTFGSFTATGGVGAASSSSGAGGGASGSGALCLSGGAGGCGQTNFPTGSYPLSGGGGNSPFGGAGNSRFPGAGVQNAAPNSGSGGEGGAGASGNIPSGGGGGAGGYFEVLITSPAATYTYSVGAGGTVGMAGTTGSSGGAGGSGVLIIDEFY